VFFNGAISVRALKFRFTWNQRGNCSPILPTVRLYRIFQVDVFVFYPFTITSIPPVDAGIQGRPSVTTLSFRSTRNQRGNCGPILATVRLYRILQVEVFLFCPMTRMCRSMLETKVSHHLLRHCTFVRPGTSVAMASQSFPP
jgi:hypothetical protein